MKSEKFNNEIQLVIKASHEAYAGQVPQCRDGQNCLVTCCKGFNVSCLVTTFLTVDRDLPPQPSWHQPGFEPFCVLVMVRRPQLSKLLHMLKE